jgi:hypothetical protein
MSYVKESDKKLLIFIELCKLICYPLRTVHIDKYKID